MNQEIQDKHIHVDWQISVQLVKRKALDNTRISNFLTDQLQKLKFGIRLKVEHQIFDEI